MMCVWIPVLGVKGFVKKGCVYKNLLPKDTSLNPCPERVVVVWLLLVIHSTLFELQLQA